ncbi:hypothetical protein RHSIM_Rhsim03G0239700 [Rhododendron simsii]|uniref:Nucleoside phosphorylase domain-containing protein n=1 Tax=Rhododendron simsii TaxID=118357 RepID=A0A834H4Z8_RHOSS|nr:hypothetical protein RHSIM_Rhsim03G0239700 [Rhododendron simsii]
MKNRTSYTLLGCLVLVLCFISGRDGAISRNVMKEVIGINKEGPYLGIVVPNNFEMSPLLQSPSFVGDAKFGFLDFSGRRFHLGRLGNEKVIVVLTGLGMLNAGIATELLLTLFWVKGVVHYGIAGNANPDLQIGDVTIPHFWAHTGLWNWQRYGDGPEDELSLESNGDYTRTIGYLEFSQYNNETGSEKSQDNLLNRIWYQPEEIFPVNGTPEGMNLTRCVNSTTCLPRTPIATSVERGVSASTFVDNRAYREFLFSKFNATAVDMESAAVSLVCIQHQKPFVAIRALSDLAGGGSSVSNEAAIFASLAAQNAVDAVIKFVKLLS